MKMFLGGLVAIGLLCAHAGAQADNKVQVSVQKKRVEVDKGPVGGAGERAKGSEKVTYELKIQNQTLQDLSKLTVDYVIFVERQKLGERQGQEGHVDRFTGTKSIDALTNREPQSLTTEEIELNASNLIGTYHYANGGRIKAQDNVVGVWVRVSQDGQIIGEYANPPTVTKRGWDQK
jgi:hypothetical protein